MSAARKLDWISLEDYLAAEELSDVKHEYIAGQVYAMAGGTNDHGKISRRVLMSLGNSLEGKPCEPYGSDTRIKINTTPYPCVFYPDVSVICDSNPGQGSFQERPVVLVEVLSKGTRQNDLQKKLIAYLGIPTLRAYIILEQLFVEATVHRRTDDGFAIEHYTRLTDIIPLPEIDTQLPLADVYKGVVLAE